MTGNNSSKEKQLLLRKPKILSALGGGKVINLKRLIAGVTAFILVLFTNQVWGAGINRPIDFGVDFFNKRDYHPYYNPSPFEQIDMLSGWPHVTIPDISIKGNGDLNLEIIRRYEFWFGCSDQLICPGFRL